MKTIITFTFLLFSFLGFSQTTREEVVKRTDGGLKLEVLTYSGTGNSEKLIKKTIYEESPDAYRKNGLNNITSKPTDVHYYGNYKVEWSANLKSITEPVQSMCYGVIKIEKFDGSGKLLSTWKITDENGEKDLSENYSPQESILIKSQIQIAAQKKGVLLGGKDYETMLRGTLTYTILP
jgi:hypothetical protein